MCANLSACVRVCVKLTHYCNVQVSCGKQLALVVAVLIGLAAPHSFQTVSLFELSPHPAAAYLPPFYPDGADVEDNHEQRGGLFPSVASNWQQRGALVKRAADLDEFPPEFAGKVASSQLSAVSGNDIVGDPARVDQPGNGELIFSEDGTPVQPTPWDIQWEGGTPAWAVDAGRAATQIAKAAYSKAWTLPGSIGAQADATDSSHLHRKKMLDGSEENIAMGQAQNVKEREAEAFNALPSDPTSLTYDEDFELAKRAAETARSKYVAVNNKLETERSRPQSKHIWQYIAKEEDLVKERAAGEVLKKAWEMQRKYLKDMKQMCPMCSTMPGPKALSDMFCKSCKQFPESWVSPYSCRAPLGLDCHSDHPSLNPVFFIHPLISSSPECNTQ